MRGRLVIGVVAALVAVAGIVAVVIPAATSPSAAGEARVTRIFIPAIKDDCRQRAEVPVDAVLGYTFDSRGAVQTIDRDGSLTGVDPDVLDALNTCLAQYPIQPTIEWPRDHYNRNLLYDYFVTDLRPCLAKRVSNLPDMPSRADFIVRLYSWDPYRRIAAEQPLAQLLETAAQCPELPNWLT